MCTPTVTKPQEVELVNEAEGFKGEKAEYFKSRQQEKCLEAVWRVTEPPLISISRM